MRRASREQDAAEEKPYPAERSRRPYEAPRLIVYGRVKDLTTGSFKGLTDVNLQSNNPISSVA
jgi:hypothetical protein